MESPVSEFIAAGIGGVLIGTAAAWLYMSTGRIAGISGITAQALRGSAWPVFFVAGLGTGGWIAHLVTLDTGPALSAHLSELNQRLVWLIAGGVLVGFGTRMGSGCTSGHGVCGIARLSGRSITATCVFLGIGMLSATVISSLTGIAR